MASSSGVLPLRVTEVLRAEAALRMSWRGVTWLRFGRFMTSSTRARKKRLNSRTPDSARFGHGVAGPVGIGRML